MKKKSAETGLTELESTVLAVIWRHQPTTAYQVRHAFTQSPVREVAMSQGSVYPVVERLKKRGFVTGVASGDARSTEHLSCTETGEGAVKSWLFDMPRQLPSDPLRTRIVSLDILSELERARWVEEARSAVLEIISVVEEFSEAYGGPFYEMAHDNARSLLLAKMRWLERVQAKIGPSGQAGKN